MARRLFSSVGLVLIVVLIIFGWNTLFTVGEWEQAIVIQLGEFKRAIQKPGLNWKYPFVQKVITLEQRILASDAQPAEYLTRDKKRVVVDHVTRWKIKDPFLFYKTVRAEAGARARLDEIVFRIKDHIRSWGIAGSGMYWKPTIVLHVAPDGRLRADDLKMLFQDSGLDLKEYQSKAARLPTTRPNSWGGQR